MLARFRRKQEKVLSQERWAIARFTSLTLQRRIGLLVAAGLVVGLGLFSSLGLASVNESTARILDERLTVARAMAKHLDEELGHVLVHLQDIDFNGALPSREQFSTVVSSLRNTIAKSGISTSKILLVDHQGIVIQAEPANSEVFEVDMSVYPEVKQVLATGQPTISGLVSVAQIGELVVLVSVPVFSPENEIMGALIGAIDIEQSNNEAFKPAITVGKTGYVEIVDGQGLVLARTSPGSPPALFEWSDHPGRFAELISQQKATVGTCHRCHETGSEVERRRDVLAFAPLATTSWGIVIRQSEEEALAPTRQLGQRLLFLGTILLIGTLLLVWLMMRGIVRPIRMLTAAAQKVAAGDFKAAMPVRRQDEIGQLSAAFYTMTQKLAESRAELVLRNEELSALNSIAVTVSQSLNLEDVLENALQRVLEVTKTTAGSVFLRTADEQGLEMRSRIGASQVFQCQEAGTTATNCACHQVLRYGQTLMVNDVSQCPRLGRNRATRDDISCFVSVPLKSKDRTLGIMNIACSDERYFTENDFRILDSIGYHVGLAIDNSVLYEEAKQKEILRGQLLSRVINAQEDERKRIARELHDDYGQTLTSLLMSIESLEDTTLPERPQHNEKLQNAKSLIVHALQDMRRLTLDLRPSTLDVLGLVATIRAYAQTNLESAGIQVHFESKGLKGRLTPAVETTLFRIIQEALHNVTKHAQANKVRIALEANTDKITAIVEDDGQGFDIEAVFKSKIGAQSLGLLGIQERATLVGGTFNIKSQVGQGTCLTVEIPLADAPGKPGPASRKRTGTGQKAVKFVEGDDFDGKNADIDRR